MSYNVSITYIAATDLFNAPAQKAGVVTAAPIPGLGGRTAPSDAYIYAPDTATAQVFNRENLADIDATGAIVEGTSEAPGTSAQTYLTSGQRRWPKAVTDSISSILEAYATPQVPVYRAWQTFKLAIDGGTPYEFSVASFAEAEFYREAGTALGKFGISVTVSDSSDTPFVAVTGITGVVSTIVKETDTSLSGTVAPANATNSTIVWSVKTAGTTGATISGSTLSTTAVGTVVVTATITNGATASTDYTKDFSITVTAS